MKINDNNWPKIGDKLKFKRVHSFWFTNVIENAKCLTENHTYIISGINVYSSWASVELEGFPNKIFSLSFFEKVSENS